MKFHERGLFKKSLPEHYKFFMWGTIVLKLGTYDRVKVLGCLTEFVCIYAVAMETVVAKVTYGLDVWSSTPIMCVHMFRNVQKVYLLQ